MSPIEAPHYELFGGIAYCSLHGQRVPAGDVCAACVADLPAIVPARRLNIGCGQHPLLFWQNLDGDPNAIADHYAIVPPLPFEDEAFDDIYAGHVLEHLSPRDAHRLLIECRRCLAPGGRLGIVVPDTREVLTRWLNNALDCVEYPEGVFHAVNDLDEICAVFLYSTVQASPHRWSYDLETLHRAIEAAGFVVTGEIDRYRDARIPVGAWYQCGLDAVKR